MPPPNRHAQFAQALRVMNARPGTSPSELKKIYLRLARQLHPDKVPNQGVSVKELTEALNGPEGEELKRYLMGLGRPVLREEDILKPKELRGKLKIALGPKFTTLKEGELWTTLRENFFSKQDDKVAIEIATKKF